MSKTEFSRSYYWVHDLITSSSPTNDEREDYNDNGCKVVERMSQNAMTLFINIQTQVGPDLLEKNAH